jgi:hypothetical protein
MARSKMELRGGVRLADRVTLGALASHVPMTEVRAAIAQVGREGERCRLLPPELTSLFVIAISLYREASYVEVLRCLFEGFRFVRKGFSKAIATKGAVSRSRWPLNRPRAAGTATGERLLWMWPRWTFRIRPRMWRRSDILLPPGESRHFLRFGSRSYARQAFTPLSRARWVHARLAKPNWLARSLGAYRRECCYWQTADF